MNWIVYLFGSGAVYYLGIGFIFASLGVFARTNRYWLQILATLLAIVGLILVALSAAPLPYALYAVAGAVSLLWLVAERFPRGWFLTSRNLLRGALVGIWLLGAALDLPFHFVPRVFAPGRPTLYIIGDSVTAGVSDAERDRWPERLAGSRSIDIEDLSQMGATTASALKQAAQLPADGGLVLLEIGGNDILGTTSAATFARDLEQLLIQVCRPGRVVVMFELPLPPFCNDYGRAQRRLASKYKVLLVPKRVFLAVLTGDATTLDSIHLTPQGHERMSNTVWSIVRPAYESD